MDRRRRLSAIIVKFAQMSTYTITYSDTLSGWTSFHSYKPLWMAGMNNNFYTFNNGRVWKHHVNTTRNNYYGAQYSSIVRTILNTEPSVVKVFKTIKLKGTGDQPWVAAAVSDLSDGLIPLQGYEKKEGNWYGYVRRKEGEVDPTFLSTYGVGVISSVDTIGDVVQLVVPGDFSDIIGVKTEASTGVDARDNGDLVFTAPISGSNIGTISSKFGQVKSVVFNGTETTIEMVKHPYVPGTPPIEPAQGHYLLLSKNSTAESYGLRGVYMDVTLTNSETDHTELFSISSELLKSFQ